jgi:hypothetical protein
MTGPNLRAIQFRVLLVLTAVPLLAGCTKGEVDKCVDAFMAVWERASEAEKKTPYSDYSTREKAEAQFRERCLRAASGSKE